MSIYLQRHTYGNAIFEIMAQTRESGLFAGPANLHILIFASFVIMSLKNYTAFSYEKEI